MAEEKVVTDQAQAATGSKFSNFLSWFNPFSRGIGMWAWIAQRLTGLFLVMYVFIHLGIIGTMLLDTFLGFETPGLLYNSITSAMSSSLVEGMGFPSTIEHAISFAFFIDAALLAALVYHGYNGIRVVLFDLGIGIRKQKTVFWILFILGIISYFLAILLILSVPEIVLSSGA
jgi:succinate dehydrogenase / fumarate reductase cytochrome b subunit